MVESILYIKYTLYFTETGSNSLLRDLPKSSRKKSDDPCFDLYKDSLSFLPGVIPIWVSCLSSSSD